MGRDAHLPAFPGLEAYWVQVKDCWEEQAPLKEVD
jgi:hypothetical protein